MRIAVSSQSDRTFASQAGRFHRFIAFEASGQAPPQKIESFDSGTGNRMLEHQGQSCNCHR